jgi:hypothetical protein
MILRKLTETLKVDCQNVFSDQNKFSTWRKLWLYLAEAEMELGLPGQIHGRIVVVLVSPTIMVRFSQIVEDGNSSFLQFFPVLRVLNLGA